MKKQKSKGNTKDNTILLTIIVVGLLIIFCAVYNVKYRQNWGWMHMYGANYGLFGAGDREEENEWGVRNMMDWQKDDNTNSVTTTIEDTFNEAKPVSLVGTTSAIISSQIEPSIKAVFGDVKAVTFSGEYLGQANSFLVTFKTSRIITEADADQLVTEFSKNGYSSGTKTIVDGSTNILLDNKKVTITISYLNSGSQEISVLYMEKIYE